MRGIRSWMGPNKAYVAKVLSVQLTVVLGMYIRLLGKSVEAYRQEI